MKTILIVIVSAVLAGAQVPQDPRVVQFYAVGDLITSQADEGKEYPLRLRELVELIKNNIQLEKPSQLTSRKHALIIVATQKEHEVVAQFLRDLRASVKVQFLVDARFLVVPRGSYRLGENAIKLDAGKDGKRFSVAFLQKSEAAEFRRLSSSTISSPRILTEPFRDTSIKISSERRFVTGYRIETDVEGYPDGLAIPIVEEFREGIDMFMFLIPARGPQKDLVTLDLGITLSGIRDAKVIERTPQGPVYSVMSKKQELRTCVTVPLDMTLMITGLKPLGGARTEDRDVEVVVLISVSRVAVGKNR